MENGKRISDSQLRRFIRTACITKDHQGYWFKTREGIKVGPYGTEGQAKTGRSSFVYRIAVDNENPYLTASDMCDQARYFKRIRAVELGVEQRYSEKKVS